MSSAADVVGENGCMFAFAPRVLSAAAIALALTSVMTGCAPRDVVTPTASAPTPSQTPTPTASAEPENPGVAIDLSCDQLITAQAMYDFNPNFSLEADFTPAAGSQAEKILGYRGIACSWVNQTSGETLSVAVAQLPDEVLSGIANELVTSSNSVPTYGVEGYFQLRGQIGEAEAFAGPYWIVAVSSYFYEPGDVIPIIDAARSSLGV